MTIPIGIFNQKSISGLNYWIATVDLNNKEDRAWGVSIDTEGGVYLAGQSEDAEGDNCLTLVKLTGTASFSWSRIATTSTNDLFRSVAVDSSNNVFAVGYDGFNDALFLEKLTSGGTRSWARRLNTSGIESSGQEVAIDSSGNVIIAGESRVSSSNNKYQVLVAKYATNGDLTWQRRLGVTTSDSFGFSVTTDSSGNVYVAGQFQNADSTKSRAGLAKWNSSGTLQWHRWIDDASITFGALYGVASDSSGNIYAAGTNTIENSEAYLVKYDTDGTLQWQRNIGDSFTQAFESIAVSGSYLYATGRSTAGTTAEQRNSLITKWDLDGNLIFQRTLGVLTLDDFTYSTALTADGAIVITGYVRISTTDYKTLVARLPIDGSLTGQYTLGALTLDYAVSELSVTSPSYTSSTSPLSGSTTTFTSTSMTPAVTTPTFTVEKVSI